MHPLNPFLRAFFRSALPQQCSPIAHHILLVPTTDVLLDSKDRETNTPYSELATTEEFLASHVLRVPGGTPPPGSGGREGGNIRDNKNKAKQYPTINGRTVVVKEGFVYSNKGFKTLNQAQLVGDTIYYPDTHDGQQWLIYYISRPLVGSFLATPVKPAVISDEPSKERKKFLEEASSAPTPTFSPSLPRKKAVKNFGDLLDQYPLISKQIQPDLERVIRDFVAVNDQPAPKQPSRSSSFSSNRSSTSMSESISSIRSSLSTGSTVHPTSIELAPEEDSLRTSLEVTITAAIELFQSVDKQQLSILGTNTELTGPVVERMIERYVCEQVNDQMLFPKVCATRKPDDKDLDSKIRKMSDIDIAQVGIPIEHGSKGKRDLAARLTKGVDAFKKMSAASSAQEMLEILLTTQKVITENVSSAGNGGEKVSSVLTINADILVSMLLVVIIRSGVRHLHSRALYMRYFIFTDEVDIGENGYALATFEAVLAHLSNSSAELRKASKRNRLLWQASKNGDVQGLEVILQSSMFEPEEEMHDSPTDADEFFTEDETDASAHEFEGDSNEQTSRTENQRPSNFLAMNGSLEHVFPFQKPPTPPPEVTEARLKKKVIMASLPRSHSVSSGYSSRSHSRHKSIDSSMSSGMNGDLSTNTLAQTQDADGNSVLMMAVEAGQRSALKFLLGLPAHFRTDFILEDLNHEGTTLLSAAIQTGKHDLTDDFIEHLNSTMSADEIEHYIAVQDNKGRCAAHYLFHQPRLIQRLGKMVPWRLKDKNGQTPLFALCRSYDHEQYRSMIESAMLFATQAQGDGERLHLDDHVDNKGNTLLHIVNDPPLTSKLMRKCDADVNAANEKRFTPLMVVSKYGRVDLVRTLFGDPRVDMTLRDLRGLTAVELAKDDDVRNRIDDLVMLSSPPGPDGRTTVIVRSFFVEDATIRLVIKSGSSNPDGTILVTTTRRSVADFENLAKCLAVECPASWLPTQFSLPSPFLIPSKPSRAILRDIQLRLDNFFRNLLTHGTFKVHELVWEFFLVPELDEEMQHNLMERSKRKAAARVESIKEDFEPVTDTQEVESFVQFAQQQIRGVTGATKKTMRATNRLRMRHNDYYEAHHIAASRISLLLFLPQTHILAFERYTKTLIPTEAAPLAALYYAFHSVQSTSTAIQNALNRPTYLIGSMAQAQRAIDRSMGSISRSNRWTPNIGLFEDTKKAVERDAWNKAGKARAELETLGCELRYTQQTVASELAAWQDQHVVSGVETLKRLAKDTIVRERARLEGMQRALRELRQGT
ncbi:Hypothetical protein R9X50_00222400 [Acrodontium crateriforme]|uniref:VPS9 domain-containing protein n=1 Tax=Acrodontium crateriforme TaxID=150365 RepID=A0AAQ3M3V0_9PEZI|nr:Hypothetical protein R9X50_00222400 [Acrodontium crateriforme]